MIDKNFIKKSRSNKAGRLIIIAILILILAAVVTFVFHPFAGSEKRAEKDTRPAMPVNIPALADSIIMSTCWSFGFSDSLARDYSSYQPAGNGKSGHLYRQPWPASLPFIIFARRLNARATERGMNCDCIESKKDGRLECNLKMNGSFGGQIILDARKSARLAGRELALIIDNSRLLKEDGLKTLMKHGIPFSYFVGADFMPVEGVQKALSDKNVTPILRLSAVPAENIRGASAAGSKPLSSDQVDLVFQKSPYAKALYFDYANGRDSSFIDATLNKARSRKMSYLCTDSLPNCADTIAALLGMPQACLRWGFEPDAKALVKIRFGLTNTVLTESDNRKFAIIVDAAKYSVDDIVDIKLLLDKLGVKIRPISRLAVKPKVL